MRIIEINLQLRQGLKPYEELLNTSKNKQIRKIKPVLTQINEYLKSFGLKLKNNCIEINTNEQEFDLEKPSENNDDRPLFDKYLRYREEAKISNQAYDVLHKLFPESPSRYQLDKELKEIDKNFIFERNSLGIFLKPREKIELVLNKFIKKNPFLSGDIKIKIAMDSCKIAKPSKNILNVTFTIINEPEKAKTAKGNYSLGNCQTNE